MKIMNASSSSLIHCAIFLGGFLAIASNLHADVKLPAIFGDHMVLQQDGKIPVWGTAASGENVKVTVGTSEGQATADADGHWRVDLPALPTNATGLTMTVAGKNTVTFQDVLVGEVWLASGQSNMELHLGELKGRPNVVNMDDIIAQAANPQIRLFVVDHQPGIIPKTDVQGTWKVCTPESASAFSAVGYFFGKDLQDALKRPVGLIGSYWGGTPIQTWTSYDALKADKLTATQTDGLEKRKSDFPKDAAAQTALLADYHAKVDDWQKNIDAPYQDVIRKWQKDVETAKAAGQPEPPRPNESANRPQSPDGEGGEPTTLFNGMINPLIPYAIKGAIWYQGESNAGGWGDGYDTMLASMITDWRTRWNEGDFTFLIVQIANIDNRYPMPTDSGWAGVRGGEAKVSQTLPKTGLATAVDLGEAHNIHPVDKFDVGKRLAAEAERIAYGQNIVSSGPVFSGMTVEGNKARIKFKDIGSGLVIGKSPRDPKDFPLPSTTEIVGFAIAGDDKKWSWAKAVINGNDVVVSSDQVPNPTAVRYGWAQNPEINLYNKDGYPAIPFRTDDWPFVNPPPMPK
jgi:sialate O-acetylesterase